MLTLGSWGSPFTQVYTTTRRLHPITSLVMMLICVRSVEAALSFSVPELLSSPKRCTLVWIPNDMAPLAFGSTVGGDMVGKGNKETDASEVISLVNFSGVR